jgi:hypothetical protein
MSQMLRVVLFGETSLQNKAIVGKAVGKIWNLKKVNPSMVSMIATYVSLLHYSCGIDMPLTLI